MKNDLKLHSLSQKPHFPARWQIVLDELVPSFVKNRFSPQESWKKKPFSQDDVAFFSKGLLELSDFFTEDRDGAKLPNYFTTAKFRSSYFLYFFALQGAKFLTLYERYEKAVDAALAHAQKTGTLKVVDVGSGPGTASIAFLVYVLEKIAGGRKGKIKLPFKIHLHWIDHNETIIKDGEAMLADILGYFEEFEGDISLTTEARAWWKHPKDFNFEASLVLFGNVLNESPNDPKIYLSGLVPFLKEPRGGGVLLLEPAFKSASQRVSQIRDELMPHPLWGPCLHEGKCPLAEGRDWCHFSVPAELPGSFFKKFSIKLGSKREWLKFSFLWIAASNENPKNIASFTGKNILRVVSDPMRTPRGNANQLCTPERISWVKTPERPLYRGDVIYDQISKPQNKKYRN